MHPAPPPRGLLLLCLMAAAGGLLAGCERKVAGPTPAPARVEPQVVCGEQLETQVLLTGGGFSPAPVDSLLSEKRLALPELLLVRTATLSGTAVSEAPRSLNPEPTDTANTRVRWVDEARMEFTVSPSLELATGVYGVEVKNPTGASATLTSALAVVPPPRLVEVRPQPVCSAQYENVLTAEGEGFLKIGSALPTVRLGSVELTASAASGCTAVAGARQDVSTCTSLTFTLPTGALAAGAHPVVVTNPAPANCASSEAITFHVVPPPSVASVEPTPLCNAQGENTLTVRGAGFLRIGTAIPSVALGTYTAESVTPGGCEPVPGPAGVESCGELVVRVPASTLPVGLLSVVVTNPEPAQCVSTEPVTVEVVPPPEVTSISPTTVCTGGGTFTITGTHLSGISATLTDSSGGIVQASNVVVDESGTSAQVSFGAGLRAETYTLTVTGATGCTSTLSSQQVTVTLGPVVFYVDPPAVYNAVAVRATVYASGLDEAPDAVTITPAGGGTSTTLPNLSWTPGSNVIQVDIPAGLAAGSYDVFVRGVAGCEAFLASGLKVVGDTTLALAEPAMRPSFGKENEDVAVSLNARPAAERSAGEVGFVATPRAYLSSASLGTAAPLRAVAFIDDTRLSAIVPPLPAGTYDLVVVNPDATVGFRAGAYRATATPPPLIDDVAPTQLSNDTATLITIQGQSFAPVSAMGVTLTCKAPGGALTTHALTLDTAGSTATVLKATVPSGLTHGAACAVRVDNTADATFDEWSALSITNPAAKLPPFLTGASLVEARRAPAMATGRATREARFLYAMGGDSGATAGALASVEAAPLGRFGEVGAWRLLQNALPAPRTLAAAHREGRYVFLLGGHNGTSALKDIHRAVILNPLEAPRVSGVELGYAASRNGLGAGAWTYVVSAVYAASDTDNPGGESLPSEPVTLYAPAVPDGVELSLTWDTVRGTGGTPAAEYRVYRTLQANGSASEMRLLAVVSGTAAATHRFTDTNPAAFANPDKAPFQVGALGTWRKLPVELATPRAAFGFVTATDPACAGYWYAIGGRTDTASESSSYDVAAFDTATASPLAFATQQAAAGSFAARRELSTWVANAQTAPALVAAGACKSFVYAAYGASGASSFVTNARYTQVVAGGLLASDEATPVTNKWLEAMAAPAGVQAAGQVAFMSSSGAYRLGGRSGVGATGDATQAELCAAAGTCTPGAKVANWSSATNNLLTARDLPGMARLGAFFYVAGGTGSNGAALSSTEMNLR